MGPRQRPLALLAAAFGVVASGKGTAPPMGWRSWNAFGPNVSQELLRSIVAAIAKPRGDGSDRRSLSDLGFSDVGLDDNWQECGSGVYGGFHDAQGNPIIDTTRFPDLKGLVRFAHERNVSMGWYLNNCICRENDYKADNEITAHYKADVAAMKTFGFDSVKIDHCGMFNDMQRWRDLFNESGQSVVIENCHWVGMFPYFDEGSGDLWCPFDYYRTSSDIKPEFDSMLSNLQTTIKWAEPPKHPQKPLSMPGCWAYPDMLEVGKLPTMEENRAHFAAWCVTSSPLILGFDITQDAKVDEVWPILSNEGLIDVNQQWAGHPGTLVYSEEIGSDSFAPAYAWGVECNKTEASQRGWNYRAVPGGGGVQIVSGGGLCVDASSPKPIGLAECNSSDPKQVFTTTPDGYILAPQPDGGDDLCLEVEGKLGPVLQLTKCWLWSGGNEHQRFTLKDGMWADKGEERRCVSSRLEYPTVLPARYISWQTWAKPLRGGSLAVLAINRQEPGLQVRVTLDALQKKFGDMFPLVEGNPFKVWDLYEQQSLGSFFTRYTTDPIAIRDSRFYIFTPVGSCGPLAPLWWALSIGAGLGFALLYCRGEGEVDREGDGPGAGQDDHALLKQKFQADAEGLGNGLELEKGAAGVMDKSGAFPVGLLQRCGFSVCASQVIICTGIWWSAAIYVTVMIKSSARYSLPFFTLTFLVNIACSIITFVLSKLVFREVPVPKMTDGELARLVGLGLIAGCEFGCLNKSLEGLAVSERTMLQNINVLLIMAAARLWNLEHITVLRVVAGLLLAGGGFLQCLDSWGGPTFEITKRDGSGGLNIAGTHLLVRLPELSAAEQDQANSHTKGLIFMICSMCLTAVKWTLIQSMTQKSDPDSALGRMSKLQLAYRMQPITGLVCLVLAAFFERCALCPELLLSSGMILRVPFISMGIALITLCELKIVQLTSAVATAVLMNVHHIPMVLAGVIFFHEVVSVTAATGFVLTCGGGIAYAMAGKQDHTEDGGDYNSSDDSDDEEDSIE